MARSKVYTANRVLSGAWAEVQVDGVPWAEATGITAKITELRQDVQVGMDVCSKLFGLKGEGRIYLNHVYTTDKKLFWSKLKGKDVEVRIIASLADPDSVGAQEERWQFSDVVFTEIPLFDWRSGEMAQKELPFVFPPSKLKLLDKIA